MLRLDSFTSRRNIVITVTAITNWRVSAVPADGVKGKTWGPSSVHGRSRGHLPLPLRGRAGPARLASSAPDLPPARAPPAGNRPPPRPARPARPDLAKKRSGSHDDLLDENEPRRNRLLLCPFASSDDLHHYDTVFDLPGAPDKAKRKGSHELKRNFLKTLRSNSFGLLAVASPFSSETTELLGDD